MKWLIPLCLFFTIPLLARMQETQSYKTLESIKPYAIELGVGKTEIYVFVDPLCPKSRAYLSTISTTGNLLRRQHYYIFLLRLEKYDSERLIRTIYESKDPRMMMQKIMIERCAPQELKGEKHAYAQQAVDAIALAGLELELSRRPSLIIIKPDAPYCVASEGEPDCAAPGSEKQ
jgi:hypothetical protein